MAALLCGLAMFGVLCFQATVAGSLLRALVPRASIDWGTWSPVVVALSISMAVAAGGSAGLVHSTSRLTAVGICGLGASAAAFVTTQALASSVTTFFPSIGIQLACSAASVSVLFAAATGVSRHRHPPGHSCGASSCARSPRA